MRRPSIYVQPIHFEDFDGAQFERLVFAYHARCEEWQSLEWYGQAGSDLGRDIWGIRHNGESVMRASAKLGHSAPRERRVAAE
jgi:hypothetical protein